MALNVMLILRAIQALFAIIVLGLTCYAASWYNTHFRSGSHSQANFLIFTSLWTLLAVVYLTLAPPYFPRLAHKYAVLALDALTMLFWFAGFIAMAVFLTTFDFCLGPTCRAEQAASVFGGFLWLLFLATTVMAALHVWRTRNSSSTKPASNMDVHGTV